jgi:hypothetical protein
MLKALAESMIYIPQTWTHTKKYAHGDLMQRRLQ